MKPHASAPNHHHVLSRLTLLPRKIIALYDAEHTSELLLHELSHNSCFNLEKAAYFVDNPDFNCFQGVAGYDQAEHTIEEDIALPPVFYRHLNTCDFNKQIRGMAGSSYKKVHASQEDIIKELASGLDFNNPSCYVWPLKHDNYGILIYQASNGDAEHLQEHIENGLHLLGFCSFN